MKVNTSLSYHSDTMQNVAGIRKGRKGVSDRPGKTVFGLETGRTDRQMDRALCNHTRLTCRQSGILWSTKEVNSFKEIN